MAGKDDAIAWYEQEIARLRQGIEFLENCTIITGEEKSRGGPLESRNADLVEHYKRTIAAMMNAVALLKV